MKASGKQMVLEPLSIMNGISKPLTVAMTKDTSRSCVFCIAISKARTSSLEGIPSRGVNVPDELAAKSRNTPASRSTRATSRPGPGRAGLRRHDHVLRDRPDARRDHDVNHTLPAGCQG
jgi:hypothetical protein